MAIKVASIFAEISVALNEFKAGMRSVKASFSQLNESAKESEAVLRRAGFALTAISAGAAAIGGTAVKTFAEFQQSIANVASVLDGMDSDFEALESAARKAAIATIFTANQAADAMYVLGSAGLEAGEIFSALEPILALAAATQGEIADTARLVVSNMVAFQIPFRDTTRVANTFAAAISNSQATLDKLINSTKFVSPVARSAGIAFEQMTAALSKLLDAGISASTAGVYLRGILLALQNPTSRAREAIAKLGLTIDDVSPQVNDLAGIIGNLEKANAGAVESGDELADIFGRRYTTAMQVLIRLGAPALREFEAAITGTNKAFELQQVQITTLKGAWLLIKSVVQDVAIAFGKSLLGPLNRVAKVARGLFLILSESFNSLGPNTQAVISGFGAFLGLLVAIVGPLTLFAGFLPAIVNGLKLVGGAIVVAAKGLITLKAGLIIGAVALAAYVAQIFLFKKGMEFGIKRPVDEFIAKQAEFQQMTERSAKFLELYENQATRTGNVIQALAVMFPKAASGMDALGRFTEINTEMVREQIDAQRKLIELESEKNVEGTVAAINELVVANKKLNTSQSENVDLQKEYNKYADEFKEAGMGNAWLQAATKVEKLAASHTDNAKAIDENIKRAAELLDLVGNILGVEGTWEERVDGITKALRERGFALSEYTKELMSTIQFQQAFNKITETSDVRGDKAIQKNADRLRSIQEKTQRDMTAVVAVEGEKRIALMKIEEHQKIAALNRERERLRSTHPDTADSVIDNAIQGVSIATNAKVNAINNASAKRRQEILDEFTEANRAQAAEIEAILAASARRTLNIDQSISQARIGSMKDLNERDAELLRHRYKSRIEQIKLMLEQETNISIEQREKYSKLIMALEEQLQSDLAELRKRHADKKKREDDRYLEEKKREAEESIRGRLIFVDNMISDVSRDLSDVVLDSLFGGDTEADRRMRDRLEDLDEFHRAERIRLAGNASAMIALEREMAERRRKIQQDANEEIGSAWGKLWEGIKRSFIRNILGSLERSLREFVKRALIKIALLKLAESEAAGGNGKLGMLIKGIGMFASLASGNPLPAFAAGAQGGMMDSPVAGPTSGMNLGKRAGGGGGSGVQVVINNDGLMRGAMIMADDPEVMDRVVRNTIEPAMQRVMSEKVM